MRAHDLWSFLAPLDRLAQRHALADLTPVLADLHTARARFDAEADLAFEAARKPGEETSTPDEPEIPDEQVDQMLADAGFRSGLDEALVKAGIPKLASLDAAQHRGYARAMIAAIMKANAGNQPAPTPPAAPAAKPATAAPQPPPRRSGIIASLLAPFKRRRD